MIDYSGIDPTDLQAHRQVAELSPDAEVYPWLPSYPRKGQTVYSNGRLWTVGAVEKGPCANEPTAILKLNGFNRSGGVPLTVVTIRSDVGTLQ